MNQIDRSLAGKLNVITENLIGIGNKLNLDLVFIVVLKADVGSESLIRIKLNVLSNNAILIGYVKSTDNVNVYDKLEFINCSYVT